LAQAPGPRCRSQPAMGEQDAALAKKVQQLEQQIDAFKQTSDAAVRRLQEQIAVAVGDSMQSSALYSAGALVGNRIVWTITNMAEKRKNTARGTSIYSEAFNFGSIRGIQLEFYPNGRNSPEPEAGVSQEAGQKGFCSIFLWCPPGTHMRYFLFCGSYARAPELDMFDSRMGHGHSNFCVLDDQVKNDTLQIGVEILEVYTPAEEVGTDLRLSCKSMKDAVRGELELIQNLHVERVEWVIKDMRRVMQMWPQGSSLFSKVFTAAGVRDMVFEFYPNGSVATSQPGYCGFYLRCPDGTSVTLTLFVGAVRKGPISARFEQAAGKGLPEFCLVQDQITADDELKVGIDIRNNELPAPQTLRLSHF